jgi:glycosyltransferase involved in cell wall biosynthesis
MPLAAESLDLSEYDLVISTGSFSKGLVVRPGTKHINYCHSPIRQFWDWQAEYARENHRTPKWLVSSFQHLFRVWDYSASSRVDDYIANSENIRARIKKYYQSDSTVIYPPVGTNFEATKAKQPADKFFLMVSRLFSHKNVDIAVKAFNRLGWRLVIIGDGPDKRRLETVAEKNIEFLGYQPDEIVQKYLSECSAFIMPQEEDFGIAPVEAMAYGKPILALKRGGALEYIEEGINGEFFEDPCEEMLADGARRIMENIVKYDYDKIRESTRKFTVERFKKEILEYVTKSTNCNSSIQ